MNLLNAPSIHSTKPLAQVIGEGDIKELKRRLENGLNANTIMDDESKKSLLMLAAAKANLSMLQLLLQFGADVNYKSPQHSTALIELVQQEELKDFKACLDCLKKYGVNLEEKGLADETAFFFACNKTTIDAAVHLYLAGANINASTANGSPLHLAAYNNNAELAGYLICKGAQIIPDSKGETATDCAKPNTEARRLLSGPRLQVVLLEQARIIELGTFKKIYKKLQYRELGKHA